MRCSVCLGFSGHKLGLEVGDRMNIVRYQALDGANLHGAMDVLST